jgi:hypothetical protein
MKEGRYKGRKDDVKEVTAMGRRIGRKEGRTVRMKDDLERMSRNDDKTGEMKEGRTVWRKGDVKAGEICIREG